MLPETGRFTFRKKERLCSKNTFSYLFENGSSLRAGAISIYYALDVPAELVRNPVMVAFAAPKRHLKEAVKRNYIKRRMREVFRAQKPELIRLLKERNTHLILLITYNSRKLASFSEIHYKLDQALGKLSRRIESREN
ncbi:MAG: ribonuclease P protein component [Bacteroidia bacterium]|nr:ribonuclease P protein component [Bacteroidia bacterium]